MTAIPIRPMFFVPDYTAGSIGTQTLNGTDDWMGWIFSWPGGDLTKVAFLATAATGSPVVTAQFFNIDHTTGLLDTGSAIGSAVDSSTLTANGIFTITGLGQSSLAAGTYGFRLVFKSGTSCAIARAYGSTVAYQTPYFISVNNGGAQTKTAAGNMPILFGSASGWVNVLGYYPPTLITNTSFADTSNPDEYGLWVSACADPTSIRICGVILPCGVNSRPDVRLNFYTGTLGSPSVASGFPLTFDRDDILDNTTSGWNFFPFATKQTVASGGAFGIGVRAASTHNYSVPTYDFQTGNEAMMDHWWGQQATLFTRENDTGALTQSTFKTPIIIPIIDGVDPGSGGGGSSPIDLAGRVIRAAA